MVDVVDLAFSDYEHVHGKTMNMRNMNHHSDTNEAMGDLLSFLNSIADKYELSEIEMLGLLEYSKRQITTSEEEWVARN